MIEEVDETLRGLVREEALKGSQVEVSFEAPTKDWAARRNAPTVNLYLYDIREDLSRRDAAWAVLRDEDGIVTGHARPPRHYKLQYMLTAWTQRPEDEHRLLSACLATLLAHETLAPHDMAGSLAEQSLPGMITVGLPLGPDRSIADVWSALGGELKPSLDVVVTVPFVVAGEVAAGAPVREAPRFTIGRPDAAAERVPGRKGEREAVERAAAMRRAATGKAAGGGAATRWAAGGEAAAPESAEGAASMRRAAGGGTAMQRRGPLRPDADEADQDETVTGGAPGTDDEPSSGRVIRIRGFPRP